MPKRRTRARTESIERMAEVMREFMAVSVFFQDAVARSGGLNSTDLQTVSVLMTDGPSTPGELARRTGLTTGGAITAVVDRLERGGWVTRERDPDDRRRVLVTAHTETVLERVGEVYGRIGARWADFLDTLTDDQLAFATELFTTATAVNREAIEELRSAADE